MTQPDAKGFLGVEFGSTRVKAVLIGGDYSPIASGVYDWENRLEGGYWTYSLEEVQTALRESVRAVVAEAKAAGENISIAGMGVSAMMHGYLAFDKNDRLLSPFRTWRNTTTAQAAAELTRELGFNIPQRWSAAHFYQALLSGETHTADISRLTTLAGYVHTLLTGEKVLGVGDASGMFPIDSSTGDYDEALLAKFDSLAKRHGAKQPIRSLLPRVLGAGQSAGCLTEEGAKLLGGLLPAGIPLCPPEGDAGTGMTATNSVAVRTGNVSAGTSVFAMVVLEKPLSRVYPEIDMVTTPTGRPVAMVHCNNCTGDIDAWVKVFAEVLELGGGKLAKSALYDALYQSALSAEPDGGGLVSYNYFSGEPVTGLESGRPLFARLPDSRFTLSNFMRSLLFSAMATLKLGMDILTQKERVSIDRLLAHGGLFKTPAVGQRFLASALETPVAVMESAGEGGAWGIALLAAFCAQKPAVSLEKWLESEVFAGKTGKTLEPDAGETAGFKEYMRRYSAALAAEKVAAETLRA